jgi:TolA-binding protein
MRKFALVAVFAVVSGWWLAGFVGRGGIQQFIDANSDKSWAPRAEFWLGYANYIMARRERAEYCYSRIVEKYPASAYKFEALYQLGIIYEETARNRLARDVYGRIMEECPGFGKMEIVREKYRYLSS